MRPCLRRPSCDIGKFVYDISVWCGAEAASHVAEFSVSIEAVPPSLLIRTKPGADTPAFGLVNIFLTGVGSSRSDYVFLLGR